MIEKVKPFDPYCEHYLGQWKPDKKQSKGNNYAWVREAEITLAKQYALPHYNEETRAPEKVYGKVFLSETKFVDKNTSKEGYMRALKKVDGTIVEEDPAMIGLGAPSSYPPKR